jgi:DNA-binding response OmpR family regulator
MLELLRKGLYEHEFAVMTAADGETGLEIAMAHEFDSIVLDIGLPRLDGYGLIHSLRSSGRRTPVLMLTARDTEDDIIRGLDLGADDYMTKPFSFPELVARLQSITRNRRREEDAAIEADDVTIDQIRHTVTRDHQTIDLTRQEFLLLSCLVQNAGECVPRQALMESVWGLDHSVGSSALDVLVNSLRAKVDAPFGKKTIRTVRGTGYIFTQAGVQQGGAPR